MKNSYDLLPCRLFDVARRIALITLLWLVLSPSEAQASYCDINVSGTLEELETFAANPFGRSPELLECLPASIGSDTYSLPCRDMEWVKSGETRVGEQEWGNKGGARCVQRSRKFRYRKRLSLACGKILKVDPALPRGPSTKDRLLCVEILARLGVTRTGTIDVFKMLTAGPSSNTSAWTLTLLGDRRAVKHLIKRYHALSKIPGKHASDSVIRKSQRNVLQALWHFRAKESRAFLKSVISGSDKELRLYARRALRRIK